MLHNLATAEYDCQRLGGTTFRMGSISIFLGWFNSSKDDIVRSHLDIVEPTPRHVLERISLLDVEYHDLMYWTGETITLHLLTHHADDLARWGIGHWLDAEAVELPPNL
jgi:hypothetical protein